MKRFWQILGGCICTLPTKARCILILIAFCCTEQVVFAQNYIGIGLHLTPPVVFDYTNTPNVQIKPRPGIGGTLTFKKEWKVPKNGAWYGELGLAKQGLRYYQVSYIGDSVTIWSDFINQHTGFPSILAEAGRAWAFGDLKNRISIGGELLFLITQDLDSIYSYDFSLHNHPIQDAVFPIFARLNIGYNRDFAFSRRISAQFQVYTSLAFQNITQGKQYILDRKTGNYMIGKYHINNSEFGVKLFTTLNKKDPQKPKNTSSVENALLAQSERKQKVRISVSGQFFKVSDIVYHIPKVDSFSISSRSIALPQIGITCEIPFRKNDLWSAVFGVGLGKRAGTMVFKTDGRFSPLGKPIEYEQSVEIGNYGIVSAGLSHKHVLKKLVFSHTLSASAVIPLEKERTYLGVPLIATSVEIIPWENPILVGWIDYANGRDKVVFGIEYNPELVFGLRKSVFWAVGLVANYSFRGTIAHGTYKVYNENTTYYGAALQRFSKLGISLRVGFGK